MKVPQTITKITHVTNRMRPKPLLPQSTPQSEKDDHSWGPLASQRTARASPSISLDQNSQQDVNSPELLEPNEFEHQLGWADRLVKDLKNETLKPSIGDETPTHIDNMSGRKSDEEEIIFDWRNMLSPDEPLEPISGGKKRRADTSLLLLPQPSPVENSIVESSEQKIRNDTTEGIVSKDKHVFEREKRHDNLKPASEREDCDPLEEHASDSGSLSEESSTNKTIEWLFTNGQKEGGGKQKDALLEARRRSDEVSEASTKKLEDEEIPYSSEKLEISQLLVEDTAQ